MEKKRLDPVYLEKESLLDKIVEATKDHTPLLDEILNEPGVWYAEVRPENVSFRLEGAEVDIGQVIRIDPAEQKRLYERGLKHNEGDMFERNNKMIRKEAETLGCHAVLVICKTCGWPSCRYSYTILVDRV